MQRNQKIILTKVGVVAVAIPFLLWAHHTGPDPGYSGVPGENNGSTCATSGCHTGTVNNPSNQGSVSITFPNGTNYVPGTKQHLVVTISDPASTQRAWGFQLTARLSSDSTTVAGGLSSTDANTQLMCSSSDFNQVAAVTFSAGGTQTCPAGQTLQYIEHTNDGYTASRGKTGSFTYEFDWTPPSTAGGDIDFYVAGNAANGDGTQNGDHIYSRKFMISPASTGGGSSPAIATNGVVNGASFQPGLVAGSWFTILGSNFTSGGTKTWDDAIVNGTLPTSLDGVSVDVGGKKAFVQFLSPTQINAVAPGVGAGSMPVTVTTSAGASPASSVTAQAFGPAFFLWPNNQPVATRADFTLAVKDGTFPGATTTAAKPGDVIILWGTGFGPTTPPVADGVQVPADTPHNTSQPVSVTINNTTATVFGAALAPGFAGLYQVAIQIPASLPDGDWPIQASIGSFSSPDGVLLSVKK